MKINILTAPHYYPLLHNSSIFLAGSIDEDKAEKWQEEIIDMFKSSPVDVLNPRRKDYDVDLKQSKNNPEFNKQVQWELFYLDKADIIALYFDPNSKAPISLLELGLFARSGKLIVCCPNGFWRKGNVEVVCNDFGIPIYDNKEAWKTALINRINKLI